MGYLKILGRAFINLMMWYFTSIAPFLVLLLPMHVVVYHSLLKESIPIPLIFGDMAATTLGVLLLYRYFARRRRRHGSLRRFLGNAPIWMETTALMVAFIVGSVSLQEYLFNLFAWQDREGLIFVIWFFMSVIGASYLKVTIDKRLLPSRPLLHGHGNR